MGGFLIAGTIAQAEWPEEWRIEICRNLANSQRNNGEADSGWGMCAGAASTEAERADTSSRRRPCSAPCSITSRSVSSASAPTSR